MDAQWFVVASQKTITIFAETKKRKKLESIRTFENPIAEEASLIPFAKDLVHYLDREYQLKHFKTLTIAAEPHFLGKIREVMKPQLEKLVVHWIRKDLQKIPQIELPMHILLDGAETHTV